MSWASLETVFSTNKMFGCKETTLATKFFRNSNSWRTRGSREARRFSLRCVQKGKRDHALGKEKEQQGETRRNALNIYGLTVIGEELKYTFYYTWFLKICQDWHCACHLLQMKTYYTREAPKNKNPLEVHIVYSACQSMVLLVWSIKSDWSVQP